MILVGGLLIYLKLSVLQNRGLLGQKGADRAAEHVIARMILVTDKNITIETNGRVF